MSLVIYEKLEAGISKIELNDPERLNAMSEAMSVEFKAVIESIAKAADKPKVLVLTGAGRAFSAGGDLEMLKKKIDISGEANRRLMLEYYHSFLGVLSLGIPIVVAINGHAVGAGLCLATACDIRVAATGAKLGFTFTRLGLHPGMGATYFLPRAIGASYARELLLTARVIDAQHAARIGLVSETVEPAEVMTRALAIAREILECGPQATAQLLESLRGGLEGLDTALQREALCQSVNYAGAEYREGVTATIEKRKANF